MTEPLQLAELLDFRPDQGIIRLHDQRVVILSAAAMGLLRKELIDTLGIETARRLMLRFGFADGYHDAVSLRGRSSAVADPVEAFRTGTVVHSLEGIVRVDLTSMNSMQRPAGSKRTRNITTRTSPSSMSSTTARLNAPSAGL